MMGLTDEELQLISDFTVFDWVEERAKAVAALSRFRPEYMSQASRELDGVFAELARALTERGALLKRLEAAEGLAEALGNPGIEWTYDERGDYCIWCGAAKIDIWEWDGNHEYVHVSLPGKPGKHNDDCQRQQALAGWRADDGG